MKAIPGSNIECSAVDETAAEFLRAQEVARPASIEELQQASESSSGAAETTFAHFDRLQAMREPREDDESESIESPAFDAWLDASFDLDEAFLEENEGALGARLIELVALDDTAFEMRKEEALSLLRQTGNIALRLHPSVHRLVTLGFAPSRSVAVEKLSVGELAKPVRVNGVSITPRRRTIIGLLRDLDARLPAEEQTNIWTLEVAPELPSLVTVSDPFRVGDNDLNTYWNRRIAAYQEGRPREKVSILSISGDKTITVLSTLENIRDCAEDKVLRTAAGHIAQWLEGKRIYYQDPDERDFELYHLGMEDPRVLMDVLRSLDVIKHFDSELFFELLGIDPSEGGRSMYFGSFLHKALYNTQRNIDATAGELGTMVISTMMHQLFTIDDHVQTYAAVVSQESLKAMAGEMKKSVDAASTPASKAQMLMMMAVPYSRMAVDAEVRRQLDALREASSENVVEELRRRIDDIEHPLKLAEYLVGLPKQAADDVLVRRELRKIFSEEEIEGGVMRWTSISTYKKSLFPGELGKFECPSVVPRLYQRIPLIDETRDDLGYALRIKVALRDAVAMADSVDEIRTANTSEKTRARQFLKFVMPTGLYREDFEAVKDGMSFWERRVAERFNYADRSQLRMYPSACVHQVNLRRSGEDRAFFVGQMLIDWAGQAAGNNIFQTEPFNHMEDLRPDLVFLSIIAHPQGKEVAFKYFDKFCEIIPAERMCEIFSLSQSLVRDFTYLFDANGSPVARTYLKYLRDQIPFMYFSDDPIFLRNVGPEDIDWIKKINRVLIEGRTPWTKEVTFEEYFKHGSMGSVVCEIDAWEIWDELGKQSGFSPDLKDAENPNGWNCVDTSLRYSPEILGQIIFGYFATGKAMAADRLPLVISYLERKKGIIRDSLSYP